jgi:hypothetical protein
MGTANTVLTLFACTESDPMTWQILRRTVIFGTPVGLGALAAVHPMVPEDNVTIWNLIHTLQIPLASLLGIGVVLLLRGVRGGAARAARLAIIPWVAFFAAFDGVAGLATGSLVQYAHAHPHAAGTVSGASEALGQSLFVTTVLPMTATAFAFVVFGGAAAALYRARRASVYAAIAIALGGIVWTFVHPIIGAPAMAILLVGAAVIELGPIREPMSAPSSAASAAP